MILRRSLIHPVITYRARLKKNLCYKVDDVWIIGQLYADSQGNKYLLANTKENEENQRFYNVNDLLLETVGMISPFKSSSGEHLFENDIVSVIAFDSYEQRSSSTDDSLAQIHAFGENEFVEKKSEHATSVPNGAAICFKETGILRCYNGSFFFEYMDKNKVSLGCATIPFYQFYAPNIELLDNHIIEIVGNTYDNPSLTQQILYLSGGNPKE